MQTLNFGKKKNIRTVKCKARIDSKKIKIIVRIVKTPLNCEIKSHNYLFKFYSVEVRSFHKNVMLQKKS